MNVSAHEKDLLMLSSDFNSWRLSRGSDNKIPESLWARAITLCGYLGIARVSKSLGLGYSHMKQKIVKSGAILNKSIERKATFIEVSTKNLSNRLDISNIEILSPSGFLLRLKSDNPSEILKSFLNQ